ncbi:DCC1-like thiol-disulfide oxidoreductase family protein [Pseudotenacibaculum sp. MALMAid0570]|uniref:thiol-disulfide oxidoreductase DCC family protein n=1 Tax=Pseudotenacibaculum sp. MALMAid0570 TaxID=3143938 RepID=UPI0032DE79E9
MADLNFDIPKGKKIILFDGVCNLCNNSVIRVIKYDKKDVFLFTALQSNTGKQILNHLKIDTSKVDSIILFDPEKAHYIKSAAALEIMKQFSGIWKLTQIFTILPNSFNNIFYDFVARNRYKWYGKKESCMIPSPELKAKFIE